MIKGDNFWMMDSDEVWKMDIVTTLREVIYDKQDETTGKPNREPVSGVGEDCPTTSLL